MSDAYYKRRALMRQALEAPSLPEYQQEEEGEEIDAASDDKLDLAEKIAGIVPEGVESLEGKASLRDAYWGELNKQAPFARPNPPSILKGTLGGYDECIPATRDVNGIFPNTSLKQVAWWPGIDPETLPVIVTFAPVQQLPRPTGETFGSFGEFRPFGIVKWGTRGFMVEAEVDIATGVQFVVGASSVALLVGVEKKSSVTVVPGENMKLAGMLSFYGGAGATPVTRTRFVDSLAKSSQAPANIATVTVPPFSRSVSLWRFPIANQVTLDFLDSDGNQLYQYVLAATTYMFDPIPLTDDVVYINVTNNTDSSLSTARLIFNLAF